ncbi:MAG: hypothetical protein AAF907_10600 [Planctomycetota bacterium]
MSPKIRRIVGLALVWLVGLALAASAVAKLTGNVGESASVGGFEGRAAYLAGLEFVSVGLLLVPFTHRLGFLLCTAYLGGAMATSIALSGLGEATPSAILQALLWTGAVLYSPELLGPMLVRPTAPAKTES